MRFFARSTRRRQQLSPDRSFSAGGHQTYTIHLAVRANNWDLLGLSVWSSETAPDSSPAVGRRLSGFHDHGRMRQPGYFLGAISNYSPLDSSDCGNRWGHDRPVGADSGRYSVRAVGDSPLVRFSIHEREVFSRFHADLEIQPHALSTRRAR